MRDVVQESTFSLCFCCLTNEIDPSSAQWQSSPSVASYVRCGPESDFDHIVNVSLLSANETVPTSIQSISKQGNFSQEILNVRQVSSGCNSSFANITTESNFSTLSPTVHSLEWSPFENATVTSGDNQRDKEKSFEVTSQRGFLGESVFTTGGTTPPFTVEANSSLMKVYIGGLFDLSEASPGSGGRSGRAELDSALMAIDHVNNQQFIPNVTLELLHNSTMCDPGVGVDAFFDIVYRKPPIVMVIGGSCSPVTEVLAEIVPFFNLVMISHSSRSSALSDRKKYPTFFRLAQADSSFNPARRMFIQHFGWNTVAVIHQDSEEFSLAINEMIKDFERHNITVKVSESCKATPEDIAEKLQRLEAVDARVIIGAFDKNTTTTLFCQVYKSGLYGGRYVWLMVNHYGNAWWTDWNTTDCLLEELARSVEGHFEIAGLDRLLGEEASISGLTTAEFQRKFSSYSRGTGRQKDVRNSYDTVWTVAQVLRAFLRRNPASLVQTFDYDSAANISTEFHQIVSSIDFLGVSGPVSFDGPDRQAVSLVEQHQGGVIKKVAIYSPGNNTLSYECPECVLVVWPGGTIPPDKYTLVVRLRTIEAGVFIGVAIMCICGIVTGFLFLCFNIYYRNLKYIKLSSPNLNNVAVAGCILVYTAVILLGLDDSRLRAELYPLVCTVRAFTFAAGFSLAFGAMFTKTYRVHQIILRANSALIKSKLLKDKQLLFIVGGLLIGDSLLTSLWAIVDPMNRQIRNLTMEPSDTEEDILYVPQVSRCHSHHGEKWLAALYVYKGILLIGGAYMAWETRKVKIPVLNDSQYIGMNVYNVVLMSIIVVVLSYMLPDQPSLAFLTESTFIFLSTTLTICLLFIPKVYAIMRSQGMPAVTTAGLTVQENTRRFVLDEKKELYYRAEVQNRVYKRQLLELDQELARLKRLLHLIEQKGEFTPELLDMASQTEIPPVNPAPGMKVTLSMYDIMEESDVSVRELSMDELRLYECKDTSECELSSPDLRIGRRCSQIQECSEG
ncbi:gamma-aminobutyric acid type B receptor subunit 2-like [Liolophura sinensis]|uniref:gamma-aminobutyric acid type B receptor subunit 2-like n=1 Tax=Liolophura sinensis TaxID=3198878 RepID=UPI00315961B5